MFKKILVANRGEIAKRIIDTCREMGILSVAVYSDPDRQALHRLAADQAVELGGSEARDNYLNMDKLIQAAQETGAEAVHPGYGFLAENADFAKRCQEAGLVFIGPPAQVIRDLGDKTLARKIISKKDVPLIPGMQSCSKDPEFLAEEAEKIGYPVLIKAAAGGGGKGMRIVYSREELEESCVSASNEAAAAFGNGDIYLEKYILRPRHVEFQILADAKGQVIHLFERECSIQRRHQKIIEETPCLALNPELREKMGQAAISAAKASGYVNAGTVEFLLDLEGNFYFLEVNTRLQVEHPITELTTGIDLVRQQILIAAGESLQLAQKEIKPRGHALECRIYAEDPENDFMPSPGKVEFLQGPSGPGIRNDWGIYPGFEVPMEYDPILSKLTVYAENRELALNKMRKALEEYVILGIKTSIPYLLEVLDSEEFRAGRTYTDLLETQFKDWHPELPEPELACLAYVLDELTPRSKAKDQGPGREIFVTPWETLGNWRIGE